MQQEPVERARRGDHDAFAVLASAMIDATEPLQSFVRQPTIRLTSFRRDGRPVGTAVNIVVDGSRGSVRTYESSGKVKRIRNNPLVDIAPSTLTGSATGATTRVRASRHPCSTRSWSRSPTG